MLEMKGQAMTILLTAVTSKRIGRRFADLCRAPLRRSTYRKLAIRYLNPERPARYPQTLQIEATSKCNLRCPSCPHSREAGRGEHLSPDALRTVLARLPWSPRRVILSGVGEPLANPRFFELVDVLAGRNIRCQFYSNGTLLSARAAGEILARPNIFKIEISCDGASAPVFEGLRAGADFQQWKERVGRFVAQARELRYGRRRLSLGVFTVLSRENAAEIPRIISLAAELGFDGLTILDAIPFDEVSAALHVSEAQYAGLHPERLAALGRAAGIDVVRLLRREATPPRARLRCLLPWNFAFIRNGGEVAPCHALFSADKAPVMGNVFEDRFLDIWHGPRFREYRRASAAGTNPLCRLCPYY
jgi:radical SAM protein with 4Fe4S-binding SPASM domain